MVLICAIIHYKPFKKLIAKGCFLVVHNSISPAVDCAGIVLKCLFCQFYDMIPLLPASCEKAANHCCPNYQQVVTTPQSPASSDEDSYVDWDCGLFASCKDASNCLELAMEVSELCYR